MVPCSRLKCATTHTDNWVVASASLPDATFDSMLTAIGRNRTGSNAVWLMYCESGGSNRRMFMIRLNMGSITSASIQMA